jgi:hypothetical protein
LQTKANVPGLRHDLEEIRSQGLRKVITISPGNPSEIAIS